MDKRVFARYALRESLSLVGMGVALFWSAGRIDWWPGWASLAVMFGWIVATAIIIMHWNPGLLAERVGSGKGAKRWDVAIVSLLGLLQLVRYIVAGLDERYGWTGGFPTTVQITALVFCVLGYALLTWATSVNAFFSRLVRIQSERAHTVVTGGPYGTVRHPAYLGAVVYELAVPFLLASWWSLILSVATAILLIVRTALEDRMLQAELEGYSAYSRRVRYRLVPGVW